MANTIDRASKLYDFLIDVLPKELPPSSSVAAADPDSQLYTRSGFIADVEEGIAIAPMSTRLTPHILSVIDWVRPLDDPVRKQFIPMKSSSVIDHPKLTFDSLNEIYDSPVPGLVHRYPDKVLFLGIQTHSER